MRQWLVAAKVTLAARRKELLDKLARDIDEGVLAIECDVTQDDLEHVVQATVRQWGKLDIVIANAGFGVSGKLKDLSMEDYRRQFETNVFGVLRTIYAALHEIERTKGTVVIIGSVAGGSRAGHVRLCDEKFALRGLAKSIAPEFRAAGVNVVLISPGFVESNIRRVDNQGTLHPAGEDRVPSWLVMRTQKAVRQILRAVASGKSEAIITGHGKLLVLLERFMPWVIRGAGRKLST